MTCVDMGSIRQNIQVRKVFKSSGDPVAYSRCSPSTLIMYANIVLLLKSVHYWCRDFEMVKDHLTCCGLKSVY